MALESNWCTKAKVVGGPHWYNWWRIKLWRASRPRPLTCVDNLDEIFIFMCQFPWCSAHHIYVFIRNYSQSSDKKTAHALSKLMLDQRQYSWNNFNYVCQCVGRIDCSLRSGLTLLGPRQSQFFLCLTHSLAMHYLQIGHLYKKNLYLWSLTVLT